MWHISLRAVRWRTREQLSPCHCAVVLSPKYFSPHMFCTCPLLVKTTLRTEKSGQPTSDWLWAARLSSLAPLPLFHRTEIWESTHITNIQLWIISTSTFFEYFPKILVIIFLSRNFHLIQNISWNNWDYRTQKHFWRKLNWLLMKLLSRYLF